MPSIIKTAAEFKKYASAYDNVFPLMQSEIGDAQYEVAKLVGSETFTPFLAAYTADPGTPLVSKWVNLLPYVQRAVSDKAIALYIPKKGMANLGQEGLTQPNGEGIKASSGWVAKDMVKENIKSYNKGIDMLLEFLEVNKATYTEWAASSARTIYKELFVYNTELFHQWYNIDKSRRTYLVLLQSLRIAEDNILEVLGLPLFTEMKNQLLAGPYSGTNAVLAKMIEPACCYLSVAYGLLDLSIQIDESGVTVFDNTGGRDSVDTKKDVGDDLRKAKASAAENEGLRLLKKLKNYLIANAATYPLYVVPTNTSGAIDNTDKNVVSI